MKSKKIRFNCLAAILLGLLCFLNSCDEQLDRDLSKVNVTLLSPANKIITSDTLQTFYWEAVDSLVTYQIQIVSPQFDSIAKLIVDTVISKNQLKLNLNPGLYQWRVRVLNNTSSGPFSQAWKLTIQ